MLEPEHPQLLNLGLGWFPQHGGGLNRYFLELTSAQVATGRPPPRAVVVGPADSPPPFVHVVGDFAAPIWLRLARLARALGHHGKGADLVDAHFALHTLACLVVPSVRRLPMVVHFHGPWAEESVAAGERGLRIAGKRAFERLVYRRARAIVVLSSAFRRVLVERYGMEPWRVHVLYAGVDLERFTPGDRLAARAALGLPEHGWVAVTARRLVPRTGVDVLIDAWAAVEHPDRLLVVLSEGSERERLEEQAARLGIADHVRFLGTVSDEQLVQAYRAADVSVVPTVELEGFGLVVLEALACGTPVVASDVTGLAEAVGPFDQGSLVPPGDAVALAARLQAAADGTLPLPGPQACRSHAEKNSWPALAERHWQLYDTVLRETADQRLRVVYLDHAADPSGAELSMLRQVPALEGVDPHVILAADGPLVGKLERAGVSVEVRPLAEAARGVSRHRVGRGRLPVATVMKTVVYVLRLARRLRRLRPDLVHTYSLKSALYGGIAGRLAGVPVVWHIHDRIAADYMPAPAVRVVQALAQRLPAVLIANSEATAATLSSGRRRRSSRRTVETFVVPGPLGAPAPPRVRPAAPDVLRVGIVGRLSPWKGQDLFLRAFARAFPPRGQPAEAVIVGGALFGDHDVESQLHALAGELGLAGRVTFTGYTDDVASELARLDILVHASLIPEPFGMVVVEGMASALPVVAAAAGGPAEVITDGVDGVLYAIADEDALVDALRRLAADPVLRARLGRTAAVRALDYRPEVLAAGIAKAYEVALSRR